MQIYNNALWKREREIYNNPCDSPTQQTGNKSWKKNYLLQMQNFYKPQSHGEHQQFASVHMDGQYQEGKASVP